MAFRPHLTIGSALSGNALLLGASDLVVFQEALYMFLMIFIELFKLEPTESFCDAHPIYRLAYGYIEVIGYPAQYVSETECFVRGKNIRR